MPRKPLPPFQAMGGEKADRGFAILRKAFRQTEQLVDMSLFYLERTERNFRIRQMRFNDPFEEECQEHLTTALNLLMKTANELAWVRNAVSLKKPKPGGELLGRRVAALRSKEER